MTNLTKTDYAVLDMYLNNCHFDVKFKKKHSQEINDAYEYFTF